MDGHPTTTFVVIDPEPADPGHDRGDLVGPIAGRHRGTEVHERVAPRVALAVPRPPASDGELDLDDRLEPIDVGPFEQTDLDQSHGPGRIATGAPRRLPLR
jgi:hypothetical protein